MSIRTFPAIPFRDFPNEVGREFPVFGKEAPSAPADTFFSSVELLLHFEGADQDTTCLDFSANSYVPTFAGNAQIDTARSRFGGTSLLLDGVGDSIKFNDKDEFTFGAGDFTIDLQANPTSVNTAMTMISKYSTSALTAEYFLNWDKGGSLLTWVSYYGTGNNSYVLFSGSWNLLQDTWQHLSVERHGNTWRIYADNNVVASHEVSRTLRNGTQSLWIGGLNHTTNRYFHGSIDEVRITKGVARYQGTHVAQLNPWPNE